MSASNSQIPFAPLGKTVVVPSDSTAPNGVQALVYDNETSAGQYRVYNSSAVLVHFAAGTTVANAKAKAVAAIAGTPSDSTPIAAGQTVILRFGASAYFSALSASAATVYVTPGQGL